MHIWITSVSPEWILKGAFSTSYQNDEARSTSHPKLPFSHLCLPSIDLEELTTKYCKKCINNGSYQRAIDYYATRSSSTGNAFNIAILGSLELNKWLTVNVYRKSIGHLSSVNTRLSHRARKIIYFSKQI